MSAISEKVRKAIFTKSNVPALVGAGKLTAVHNAKAPEDAVFPFGIFTNQAPSPVEYTFSTRIALESGLWLFKVVTDENASTTKEPQEQAEELLTLWETTLGDTLTLDGNSVAWMARFADMPPFEEQRSDRYIFHRGFILEIGVE